MEEINKKSTEEISEDLKNEQQRIISILDVYISDSSKVIDKLIADCGGELEEEALILVGQLRVVESNLIDYKQVLSDHFKLYELR
jgi:hypothetical protein